MEDLTKKFSTLSFEEIQKQIIKSETEKEKLKRELTKCKREIINLKNKGANCSKSGLKYEENVYNILRNCTLNGHPLTLQDEIDLGGSTSSNDLTCNLSKHCTFGLEIKKARTPDWMQCTIHYDSKLGWVGVEKRCKIPKEAKELFNKLLKSHNIFDGEEPPFKERKLTYDEWLDIKEKNKKWNDHYFDIPNDTIAKMYSFKNCPYIQVSDGYGLYYTNKDICNFGVPKFVNDQRIRVRIKVHRKENKDGSCSLSVTAACQPKSISRMIKSPYSFDDINKLPPNIIYNKTE